ncbi:lipopolysaccharide biosynthesis protein [Kocuria rosea]|jgi:O-antigen/teichoic acid export membrane protein|uniref:lipopolysaccharide biosynthesis protein n=1 Tax=Kocuria rosea TaxID=1275 RepID=UPI00203E22D1|nr:oligosaccharide flippase family protein [Kocuria rosea]MCM3687997.1 oligosaccharide flippase family protein [Kocuria rosea]HST72367.1 oligosaccharide flippase family protein [Kocuria rosea]
MTSRLRAILLPPPNHENTDNPLGSAFALTVVAVFVQGLTRFGYSILVGRVLGKEALADVTTVISVATLLVLLWPQGSGTAASKFIAMARSRQDRVEQAAVSAFTARSAATAMAGLSVVATVFTAFALHLPWHYALSTGLFMIALASYTFVRGVRTGNNQFVTTTAWDAISSFISLTALTLVLLGGWTPWLMAPLIVGYLLYAFSAWPRRAGTSLDPGLRRDILVFTAWTSAHLLTSTGLLQLSVVIGRTIDSKEALGLYSAAVSLATPASMLSGSMLTALSPSVSRMYGAGDVDGLRAQVDRIMRIMVLVFLPVFAVGMLWADVLLAVVYGASFAAAEPLLVLLFAAVSLTSFNAANARLSGTVSWGVRVLAAANALGLVVGVATIWALAPTLGVLAAAVGYLVGTALAAVIPLAVVWRYDRMPWAGTAVRLAVGYTLVTLALLAAQGHDGWWLRVALTAGFLAVWALMGRRDLVLLLRRGR